MFYEPKSNQIVLSLGWSSKFSKENYATTSHKRPKQSLFFTWMNFIIIRGLFFTQISKISRDFSYWNENFVKTKFVVTWVPWRRITKYDRSPIPSKFSHFLILFHHSSFHNYFIIVTLILIFDYFLTKLNTVMFG